METRNSSSHKSVPVALYIDCILHDYASEIGATEERVGTCSCERITGVEKVSGHEAMS